MDDQGWVKIWRKTIENPVLVGDTGMLALWLVLLMLAAHKEREALFKGQRIIIRPGQLITGRKYLAEVTGLGEWTVERKLKKLKTAQQIEQQTSTVNRLITVLNWDKYQKDGQPVAQRPHNDRTTTAHIQEWKNEKNVRIKTNNPPSSSPPGVSEVMAAFYKLNPGLRFGSKPERTAAAKLVQQHGLEKLLPVIESLAVSNLDRYAPKVYTPLNLVAKWAALADHWKRAAKERTDGSIQSL